MDSHGSNPPFIQLNVYSDRLAENVVGFQQLIDEVMEAIEEDESFNNMTAERYNQKNIYLRSHLTELSSRHNSLADQFGNLLEELVIKCPSSLIQNQEQLVSSHSDSGSESSISSMNNKLKVKDDTIKVEEIKDSSSESSMSTANKPPVPPVNDDALKVKEANDPEVLNEKICSLEEEVASLTQKVESLTDENVELKQENEENVAEVRVFMSEVNLGIEAMEEQLKAWKEKAMKIDERVYGILVKKTSHKSKHDSVVTGQLKEELKAKSELVDELSGNISRKDEEMERLRAEKRAQDVMIEQLKARLNSVKFDKVQKLTDEVKLKVVELEERCRMKKVVC